ncbi:MAG: ATP-binding protein [Planctomycetota bacterium]|nr:ATP-binding protein [Planctomycetota bacterium]
MELKGEGEMKERKVELVVSNMTENLATVRKFVMDTLADAGVSEKVVRKIILAVDEAVTNIIRHAYEEFSKGTRTIDIKLCTYPARKCVEVTLHDSGKEFNPDEVKTPNMDEHIRLRKKYGLGIFLIRKVMDEVNYMFRTGEENILRMVKYLENDEEKEGDKRDARD